MLQNVPHLLRGRLSYISNSYKSLRILLTLWSWEFPPNNSSFNNFKHLSQAPSRSITLPFLSLLTHPPKPRTTLPKWVRPYYPQSQVLSRMIYIALKKSRQLQLVHKAFLKTYAGTVVPLSSLWFDITRGLKRGVSTYGDTYHRSLVFNYVLL